MRIFDDTEKAKQTAQTLQAELTFAKPMTDKDRQLYDTPPPRKDLSFSKEGKVSAAKRRLARDLSDQNAADYVFCVACAMFVDQVSMEADHAFSYRQIRERQLAFLNFLNEHADFAHSFLAQPGMRKYFGKNKKDTICGTGYFYKACYNEMDNLWLLCHACNVKKSDRDPLTWLRDQEPYFGEAFITHMKEAGGLQAGIFIDRVYLPQAGDREIILGDRTVRLFTGDSKGLGRFARDWFATHHQAQYAAHQKFFIENFAQFKEQLLDILSLQKEGQLTQANRALRRLKRLIKEVYHVQAASWLDAKETLSSSVSETSSVEKVRIDHVSETRIESKYTTEIFKQMRKQLEEVYSLEIASELLPAVWLKRLDLAGSKEIQRRLTTLLAKHLAAPEVKGRLVSWFDQFQVLSGTEHEALSGGKAAALSLAEAAEAKAAAESRAKEEERKAKEEERRAKEEERRAKEALAVRVKELETQLASRKNRVLKRTHTSCDLFLHRKKARTTPSSDQEEISSESSHAAH